SLFYSYVILLYLFVLLFVWFRPLYFASFPSRYPKLYLLLLVVVLIFKAWNLYANWLILKTRDLFYRGLDIFVRAILNVGVSYFLIAVNTLCGVICIVLFMAVFCYFVFIL